MGHWRRHILLALLCLWALSCDNTRWWQVTPGAQCDPHGHAIIADKTLWKQTIAQQKPLFGCLIVYWAASEGESRTKLVQIDAKGRVFGQNAQGIYAAPPSVSFPSEGTSQHFFQLFVFGTRLQQPDQAEQRKLVCNNKFRSLQYRCDGSTDRDCWFLWRFSPTSQPSTMACRLLVESSTTNPFDAKEPVTPSDAGSQDTPLPDNAIPQDRCSSTIASIENDAERKSIAHCKSLTSLSIDARQLSTLSLPNLESVSNYLSIKNTNQLKELHLPKLRRVENYISIEDNKQLVRLDLPALVEVDNYVSIENNPRLEDILMTKLQQIGGYLAIRDNKVLRTLKLPALVKIDNYASIENNPALCVDEAFFVPKASRTSFERNKTGCGD